MRSSEVSDPWDKWEDVDLASCCVFDEMLLEPCDKEVMFSRPIDFAGSSTDEIDYATEFCRGHCTLKQLLSANLPDDCNDANSIWSILTDKLLYCQSDTSNSVRYFPHDSLKAESGKQRFFDDGSLSQSYCLCTFPRVVLLTEAKEASFWCFNVSMTTVIGIYSLYYFVRVLAWMCFN